MHPERQAAFAALAPGSVPAPWMWPELLAHPSLAAPWPYTAEQIDAIGDHFPDNSRAARQLQIGHLARQYLAKEYARRRLPKKPNPAAETDAVRMGVEHLVMVLENLSPDAFDLLSLPLSGASGADGSPSSLYRSLMAFRYASLAFHDAPALSNLKQALQSPPSKTTRRGRPPNLLRDGFLGALRGLFDATHPTAQHKQGFPALRKIALEPLRLPPVSPKALEKAHTSEKRRKKSTKNG
ncbi:hypothetical protein LGR54_20790 [Ancylobacter sp. Lp-2]|uniref:hypothetical protein n=1 Tax=Ancylobacter sp. Lp-2 TaxID=2881339 RepID=UPI001E555D33|nr:hypothetical protein [Ancylobacter sp. Lp-2]MCB4771051.1 hypothetical protein [Ancylobacter sp. Lp-2]